jgi:ParB-like chromosome segregation protein Spo0J
VKVDALTVPIDELAFPLWGWHDQDDAMLHRLARSLTTYGQVLPLLVRSLEDGQLEIVDGRWRLALMRRLRWTDAWVVDVGPCSSAAAVRLALTLSELRLETNYVEVARAVGLAQSAEPDTLATLSTTTPFPLSRLERFTQLLGFDWSRFEEGADTSQLTLMPWTEQGG